MKGSAARETPGAHLGQIKNMDMELLVTVTVANLSQASPLAAACTQAARDSTIMHWSPPIDTTSFRRLLALVPRFAWGLVEGLTFCIGLDRDRVRTGCCACARWYAVQPG